MSSLDLKHVYTFQFSYHPNSHNKDNPQCIAKGWELKKGTISDYLATAKAGKAVTGAIYKDGQRSNDNVLSRKVFELDFDAVFTSEDAQNHPLTPCTAGLYTSASHQKEKFKKSGEVIPACDRFRIIFVTPYPIKDAEKRRAIIWWLHKQYDGKADQVAKADGNLYFGNTEAEIIIDNPSVCLPVKVIDQAIAEYKAEQKQKQTERLVTAEINKAAGITGNGFGTVIDAETVEQLYAAIPARTPGADTYGDVFRATRAIANNYGLDFARSLLWKYSPACPGWNPDSMISSMEANPDDSIQIGSLIHLAESHGAILPKEAKRAYAKAKQRVTARAAIARFDITPNKVISDGEKYLPDGIIPTDKKIVGLKAPKGCGKSVQLGKYIELIRSMGLIPVQLTHRRNLSSEKAKEWGLTYIESDAPAPSHFPENGVSLVVDSCLKLKQIPNIPHERLVFFLDESEQVLSHTTDSDTAIKRNRAAVMDFISTLLNRCHQVILADADLKTISIEWAKSLCGCGDDDVYLIEKKYKHNRTAIIFDDTPDLVVQLTQDLQRDDNCYTALSGQKVDSIFGSQNLEGHFQSIAKSQIRVDSDTNKDPSHPAYRIAKNLGILNESQLTFATNTLGTGSSIEGDHFGAVYAIATGSSAVESFLQQPERVRNDAPRYIAVSSVANGQSQKYGGVTSVQELMLITGKHGDAIRSHLKDFGDFGDDWLFNPWVRAWAERTCLNNHLGKDYLGSVVALMEADGYKIERRSLCTKKQRKEIRALLKGNAIEKTQQYISDILLSSALLGRELEASKAANDKTYPERCSEVHGTILELYGDDSEAIAAAHITEPGFHKKLQLHFWLGQSTESVRERDKRKLHYLKKDSHGKLFPNDIRKICLTPKIVAIKKHRLDEILTRGYIHAECPIMNEFRDILQDENKRNEASLELGIGLDACPQKSIGSMGKWLLDNLFGLGIGDRRKQDGILIYPIESGDIHRDTIFGFWEQNMIIDELEQPDFTPAPEPMTTAIAPENRSDSDQLIFSIGKSDPPPESFMDKDSQTTDHFFKNTALNFSPPEITPPATPAPVAIAETQGEKGSEKEKNRLETVAIAETQTITLDSSHPLTDYKAGDKVWFRCLYRTSGQWVQGEIDAFIQDAQGTALRIFGAGSHWGMIGDSQNVAIALPSLGCTG